MGQKVGGYERVKVKAMGERKVADGWNIYEGEETSFCETFRETLRLGVHFKHTVSQIR